MRKTLFGVLTAALIVSFLASCSGDAAQTQRLVALAPADCEILYAIGAGDMLVGRGEYCDYPAAVLDVVSVQSGFDTNVEQIVALKPTCIIMTTMSQTPEQAQTFENAGITTVVTDAQSINDVYATIIQLGDLTDKQTEATALVSQMKNDFNSLEKTSAKTVYFEVSPLKYGLWTAGSGTFMSEIAQTLGLTNIFEDISGWAEISQEQVIDRNPDVIVTIDMYFGEGETPTEEISNRPGWNTVKAVANNRVFNADADELSRPGPRLVDGAKHLSDFINR